MTGLSPQSEMPELGAAPSRIPIAKGPGSNLRATTSRSPLSHCALVVLLLVHGFACSSSDEPAVAASSDTPTGGTESGGNSGGGAASGGAASGGAPGTGGTTNGATGGSDPGSAGGTTGTGGADTGGQPGAGGSALGGVGGSAGSGGSDASGGATAGDPSSGVDGFASVAAQGVTKATGGGTLPPVDVTTCDALADAVSDDTPRVIRIPEGTVLDCGEPGTTSACQIQCSASAATPVFWRIPVGDQTCTTLADFNGDGSLEVPAGTLVTRNTSDRGISIGSNKTLYGSGAGASILGVSFSIQDASNVILRNLRIGAINPDLIEAGDGLSINTSHHIWIDHCEFSMISDGYFDIRYDSSHVTLSYNHIVGQNEFICGEQHNFVSLVDNAPGVTFHHNYFDHPGGRNPKVGGTSLAHLYNNYYEGVSYFCSNSGAGSQVLVENNHYADSSRPHWKDGGLIEAAGNVYTGTTSATYRDGGDDVFTPPYDYDLDAAADLNVSVPANAGPKSGLGF